MKKTTFPKKTLKRQTKHLIWKIKKEIEEAAKLALVITPIIAFLTLAAKLTFKN